MHALPALNAGSATQEAGTAGGFDLDKHPGAARCAPSSSFCRGGWASAEARNPFGAPQAPPSAKHFSRMTLRAIGRPTPQPPRRPGMAA